MAITENVKALNKEHNKARDIAEGKVARPKLVAPTGSGRAVLRGLTFVVSASVTQAFIDAMPKQLGILITHCNNEFNGSGATDDLQNWWVKSNYFDETGTTGYKQDVTGAYVNSFLKYYLLPSGATKALFNRGYTKEQVNSFIQLK